MKLPAFFSGSDGPAARTCGEIRLLYASVVPQGAIPCKSRIDWRGFPKIAYVKQFHTECREASEITATESLRHGTAIAIRRTIATTGKVVTGSVGF